jgi:hypothetical protein
MGAGEIRRNYRTGEVSPDPLRWGLIPYWCADPAGGRKPINANIPVSGKTPSMPMQPSPAGRWLWHKRCEGSDGRAKTGHGRPNTTWRALPQNIELMPQHQDFGFQPLPR